MATPAPPHPRLSDRIGQLDRRRWLSRARAPIWFVISVFLAAMAWALGIVVVVAMLARGWSLFTGAEIEEVPIWGWAPAAVVGVVTLVVLVVFATLVGAGLLGVSHKVLAPLGSRRPPAPGERIGNLVHEVALGLGIDPPRVEIVTDPAPNMLSIPVRGRGLTIVATSGTALLVRDELEAMVAHELIHRYAPDARWVVAAQFAVARARQAGLVVLSVGGLLAVGSVWALLEASVFLPTPFVGGLALLAIGGITEWVIKPVGRQLRSDADQLADVGTVHLTRHPEALARVCDRLCDDAQQVAVSCDVLDLLWFELRGDTPQQGVAELRRRADAAYAAAGLPRP